MTNNELEEMDDSPLPWHVVHSPLDVYLTWSKGIAMLQYLSFRTTFNQHREGHYGSMNMPCGGLVIKIMDPVVESKEKAMSQSVHFLPSCPCCHFHAWTCDP